MRIARTLALSAALISVSALSASAQILKKIGQRAQDAVERKTEQKINQKIDQAADKLVDRSFDSVFGDATTDKNAGSNGKSRGNASSRIFSVIPNAPTESQYNFDVVFTYEMENIPKGKPAQDQSLMLMHFNKDGNYAGTRIMPKEPKKGDGELFAIFDVKNESMVMLFNTDDGKFSMAYGWKDAKQYIDSSAKASTAATVAPSGAPAPTSTPEKVTFTSLGKRSIAGYNSEGYRSETVDGIMDVWVSTDPSLSYGRMMGASSSMKQMKSAIPAAHPAGMLMETVMTDKKSGDKSRFTVTKIDKSANVRVDMAEYPKVGSKP